MSLPRNCEGTEQLRYDKTTTKITDRGYRSKERKKIWSYAVVTLKKGEGRTLKAGGAWIFDNEIESITGGFDNGSLVLVHDFDGYPMGRGFINQNSKIRVRMMTRNIHQEIDESFLRMRVKNAWEYRKLYSKLILSSDLR